MAGMASAIYGMSVMVGPTLGPTLGGYLTDNFGWRSIFNINLPLGIAVAILSFLLVEDVGFDPAAHKAAAAKAQSEGAAAPAKPKRQRTPVDVLGLGLLVVGIGCAQFVLERGHAEDWFDSKLILVSTVLAVVCLTALIWWELRTEHPILELKHFKNVTFRSGVLLMTGLGAMLYGLIFLLPVFVATIQGLTATDTGELFIPGALASAAMMPIIGNQLRKGTDPRFFVTVGVMGLALGVWLISDFDSATSVNGMFWPLLIRGAAMAYLFVPINSTVLVQFKGPAIGQAAGMLNLCRQLGGSLCIAVLSTLFQQYQDINYAHLSSHLTMLDPAARGAFQSMAGGMHGKLQSLVGLGTYSATAIKFLYYRAKREAFVLSFQKVLKIATLAFVLVLIPIRTLRPLKNLPKGPLPDAH
jgi:DHA2 family multidrug resistance protein